MGVLLCFPLLLSAQPMKNLDQLINREDPGWPVVLNWMKVAKNGVEVLPRETQAAADALLETQVSTRSPMGAIVYESGGILIDGGWIRILGSGHERLPRSLPDWNRNKAFDAQGEALGLYLIADDAVGGFFALNGGGLGDDTGKVYYLAPDNLEWEPLDLSYSDFLIFCFSGDLAGFYKGLRWKGWKKDLSTLKGDEGFSFFPHLWTREGKSIDLLSRRALPIEELYLLMMDVRRQLGIE
jgi:hypothetical protein